MCIADAARKHSHFFNTFFTQQLRQTRNQNPLLKGKYCYQNVKGWSKKVKGKDIFKLKYIVCPVHHFYRLNGKDSGHWSGAIIFMEMKIIRYYDSNGIGEGDVWLKALMAYLKDEYHAKGCGVFNANEWKTFKCAEDTPQQDNSFDCGVYFCMFAELITQEKPLTFTQQDINQCRRRIASAIINFKPSSESQADMDEDSDDDDDGVEMIKTN